MQIVIGILISLLFLGIGIGIWRGLSAHGFDLPGMVARVFGPGQSTPTTAVGGAQ